MSYASPRDDSGTHARRNEAAFELLDEEGDVGRCSESVTDGFCCMRAMKPGILSLDDGVGCTYTYDN